LRFRLRLSKEVGDSAIGGWRQLEERLRFRFRREKVGGSAAGGLGVEGQKGRG